MCRVHRTAFIVTSPKFEPVMKDCKWLGEKKKKNFGRLRAGAFVESSPSSCCSVTAPLSSSFKSSFQLIGSLSCARLCKFITPQQYSAATGGKKCLQPPLFCSTSPIEGLYDVLIKKLTGAMHNLLSSLTLWPLGGQLGVGQCLLSRIVTKREGSPGG